MRQDFEVSRGQAACYLHPLLGTFDSLGHLEVSGPVPAQEMGLRPRQRVRLVGTAYEPETVGAACELRGVTPRYLVRPKRLTRTPHQRAGATRGAGTTDRDGRRRRAGHSPERSYSLSAPGGRRGRRHAHQRAYQDHATVRVADDGEPTSVTYRLHAPELAGCRVALVSDVARRPTPLWLALPVLIALCAAIAVSGHAITWRDRQATRGHYLGKSDEEIRADLETQVDWDSMEISVASTMSVIEGETTVEARIENVEANHCDQRVRIYESDDPADVLYESGAIAPGEYVQHIELAHPLSVGTHEVVVEFQGYEREPSLISDTGELLGHDTFGASCAAEVTIYCAPRAAVPA